MDQRGDNVSVLILFLEGMKINQRTATVETADEIFFFSFRLPRRLLRLRKDWDCCSSQEIRGAAAVLASRHELPE